MYAKRLVSPISLSMNKYGIGIYCVLFAANFLFEKARSPTLTKTKIFY